MSVLRARNAAVQIRIETTEGQDPGGWGATDILAAQDVTTTLGIEQIALEEYGGTLDAGTTIPGPPRPQVAIRGALRGSGAPAAPIEPWSAIMRAAAFTETRVTATIPASGTTTAASGTAYSVTFPTSGNPDWPNTTAGGEVLIGRAVELSGNPATATTALIVNYTVASGNITVTLSRSFSPALSNATQIRVLTGTRWIAATPSPHPSVHVRTFRDGVMERIGGARPSLRMTFPTGRHAQWDVTLRGQWQARTDAAVPTPLGFPSPQIGANAYCTASAGNVYFPLRTRECTIDVGLDGQYPDDIHEVSGSAPYLVGSRRISGSVDPLLTLVATRNVIPYLLTGTPWNIAWQWGAKTDYTSLVGLRFGVLVRSAVFLDTTITADNVVLREALAFGSNAFDGGLIIYHF